VLNVAHTAHRFPLLQVCKLSVKDTVAAEPVDRLPPAALVTLQVARLRPKGADECRFESDELVARMRYLTGAESAVPGARPKRWPASIRHDFYLVWEATILSCKVRAACTLLPARAPVRLFDCSRCFCNLAGLEQPKLSACASLAPPGLDHTLRRKP
jgi:hypothetical protein